MQTRDIRDPAPALAVVTLLSFDVPDASAVHARLEEAGARIVEQPVTYPSRTTAAAGKPLTGRVLHVFDPDDYLIDVIDDQRIDALSGTAVLNGPPVEVEPATYQTISPL